MCRTFDILRLQTVLYQQVYTTKPRAHGDYAPFCSSDLERDTGTIQE